MAKFAILGIDHDMIKGTPSSAPIRLVHVVPVETQCLRAKIDPMTFLNAVNDWAINGYKEGFVYWFEKTDAFRVGIEFGRWTLDQLFFAYAFKVRSWGKSRRRFNDEETSGRRAIVYFLFVPVMDLLTRSADTRASP